MSAIPEADPEQSREKIKTRHKVLEVLWDGPRSQDERKLVQRLDLFLMSWATYGYFVRLLDSSNITNAYVSGMKEDLNFQGNEYNLLTTFFTCGYLVGQIPSQLLLTRIRPSWYLPTVELIWSCLTFTFAAVQNVRHVFAIRFLVGLFESGFAVGVITLMGSWYTPRELAKRIAIFYSASYAAQMFSGYLQAGIYRGMDDHLGMAGWRWLFIFCGVISLPGAFFGYYAIPDTPYNSRARWLTEEQKMKFRLRVETLDRRGPVRLSWAKMRKIFTGWRIYIMTLALM
jgi:MFS transporter, ACS family, pantothenate transporter